MIGTAARDGEGGQDERRASESRREKYGHGQGDCLMPGATNSRNAKGARTMRVVSKDARKEGRIR